METNELVLVKVSSTEQLLGAGYVPEGRNLRGKKGDLVEASFLSGYAGKTAMARMTESEEYPVTVDGLILNKAAVQFSKRTVAIEGETWTLFEDGSVSVNSRTYSAKEAAGIAAGFAELFGKGKK